MSQILTIARAAKEANWSQTEGSGTHAKWTRRDQTLVVEFDRETGNVTFLTYEDEFEDRPRHRATDTEALELIESIENPWGL